MTKYVHHPAEFQRQLPSPTGRVTDGPSTDATLFPPLVSQGKDAALSSLMSDAESDLLRSSLDLLILRSLTWGPMHGYAIAEWIEERSNTVLLVEEGTLYPALHRLERRGWITSEWGVSDSNRRAKFYRLTSAGRDRFRTESRTWHRHADAIAAALRATQEDA